jgi:hypothetical protein
MKRGIRRSDADQLAKELAALFASSVKELKDRWRAQRLLDQIGGGCSSNRPVQVPAAKAIAGTVLIREWGASVTASQCSTMVSSIRADATSRSRRSRG